jgi:hypothetical protein
MIWIVLPRGRISPLTVTLSVRGCVPLVYKNIKSNSTKTREVLWDVRIAFPYSTYVFSLTVFFSCRPEHRLWE